MNSRDLSEIRADVVRQVLSYIRLGHNDAALSMMGYAAGAIKDARALWEIERKRGK